MPGPDSDIWKLKDPAKFEASLKVIGDALIAETIDNYTNNATKSEGDRLGMGGSWKTWVPTMAVMLVAGSWIL